MLSCSCDEKTFLGVCRNGIGSGSWLLVVEEIWIDFLHHSLLFASLSNRRHLSKRGDQICHSKISVLDRRHELAKEPDHGAQ